MATPGQLAAAYARDNATNRSSDGYSELSAKMCWDAVVHCLVKSGAMPNAQSEFGGISATGFSQFVRMADPVVGDAAAMRRVPEGALLGFVEHKNNTPTLIHAMIATGQGLAAGNKNLCIGFGNPVGWEILDLANKLQWIPGQDLFNAVPRGQSSVRLVQIRFRTL